MSSKRIQWTRYRAECPNGCGVLQIPLKTFEVAESHSSKPIQCKNCNNITEAEKLQPKDD